MVFSTLSAATNNASYRGSGQSSHGPFPSHINAMTARSAQMASQRQADNQNALGHTRLASEMAMFQQRSNVSPFVSNILASGRGDQANIDSGYRDAMGDIDGRGDGQITGVLDSLKGDGDGARDRIYRDARADRNSVGSQLAGTGLYNTSVLGTLQMHTNRNRNEALGQLDDNLRREKAGYLADLTSKAMDRRMQLMQGMLGQQGASAGQLLSLNASMRGAAGTSAGGTSAYRLNAGLA